MLDERKWVSKLDKGQVYRYWNTNLAAGLKIVAGSWEACQNCWGNDGGKGESLGNWAYWKWLHYAVSKPCSLIMICEIVPEDIPFTKDMGCAGDSQHC